MNRSGGLGGVTGLWSDLGGGANTAILRDDSSVRARHDVACDERSDLCEEGLGTLAATHILLTRATRVFGRW